MFENVKAVLFDLDGTLIDSMWMWHDIDVEYLERFGIAMPDDLQEAIAGISITQTAWYFKNRFGIEDSIDQMIADWDELAVKKYRDEVPLKKGAGDFLKMLNQRGIPCAIGTSSSRRLTDVVLNARGIRSFFSEVITGEDVHNGKPAPDIYLECARKLGVAPEYCLVFEDIPKGIEAARAAGMRVCAVEDGYSAEDAAVKMQMADVYIKDYDEIIGCFKACACMDCKK